MKKTLNAILSPLSKKTDEIYPMADIGPTRIWHHGVYLPSGVIVLEPQNR